MKNQKKKGFTLIELLVVIAIIGLLATLSVVALNNARERARDSRRVSDIKQIQTALELYFDAEDEYPPNTGAPTTTANVTVSNEDNDNGNVMSGIIATFDSESAVITFMDPIPSSPTPADGTCTDNENRYIYKRLTTTTYTIDYCLGDGNTVTATQATIGDL